MLKKLWTQFISNPDSSLVILISIFAAFYGLFSNQSLLLTAISGTVGLVAYGMIKDRNARDELLKQIQLLKESPSVGAVLLDRDQYIPFRELTASARKICLVGPTLVFLFNDFSDYFRDIKLSKHGATIQAIILDAESSEVEYADKCIDMTIEK